MASHNDLGKEAERMAIGYLADHGYEILYHNWRYLWYEIDIIAMKEDLLRIIEVKALKTSEIRYPEESVTKKKFRRLQKAADEFLFQNQQYRNLQFEILAITMNPGGEPEYFLIGDLSL